MNIGKFFIQLRIAVLRLLHLVLCLAAEVPLREFLHGYGLGVVLLIDDLDHKGMVELYALQAVGLHLVQLAYCRFQLADPGGDLGWGDELDDGYEVDQCRIVPHAQGHCHRSEDSHKHQRDSPEMGERGRQLADVLVVAGLEVRDYGLLAVDGRVEHDPGEHQLIEDKVERPFRDGAHPLVEIRLQELDVLLVAYCSYGVEEEGR